MIILVTGTGKKPSGWVRHRFSLIHSALANPSCVVGPSILRKIREAVPECNEHQGDFEELTRLLKLKFPEQLTLWKQQVEDWEADSTKYNPFEVKSDGKCSVK